MENNKLLIGVQFNEKNYSGGFESNCVELYVLRDITFKQLIIGIKSGLKKHAINSSEDKEVYEKCLKIFDGCINENHSEKNTDDYFQLINVSVYNNSVIKDKREVNGRYVIPYTDMNKPICELGFVDSTKLIFGELPEEKGIKHITVKTNSELDYSNVISAFNPESSKKIIFPEYNISTRQLWKFDDTPVDIISPTEPPKKPEGGIITTLIPTLLTTGCLLIARSFMMNGGTSMMIFSIVMGIATAVSGIVTRIIQRKKYDNELKNWKKKYRQYIDDIIDLIKNRQEADAKKLCELYPAVETLINPGKDGIYSLNENLYSRSFNDDDFLSFRLGISDDVPSLFKINGERKESIYSDTFYDIVHDIKKNDRVRLFLRNECITSKKDNLVHLPAVISDKYKNLKNAPLMYSLKNKSALGIIDKAIYQTSSNGNCLIFNMITELCYYHSPEELQFVIFFNSKTTWKEKETTISCFKFLPHFRGLFRDKSQFVFDKNSADSVMSSLYKIMSERSYAIQDEADSHRPHIVMIIYNEYGLKENVFAEFLPRVPQKDQNVRNTFGLSFVFACEYKEYLPMYCDDVIDLSSEDDLLIPRESINHTYKFTLDGKHSDIENYTIQRYQASRFLSAVYYAVIAENGKVPSTVSFYNLFDNCKENTTDVIKENWEIGVETRKFKYDVTKNLKVPVGKTESSTVYLDLHEKGDGPHMLVAGTTGSGKTETIISYLLGLCLQFRPDELNLLLVDMKGGGFTKRIGNLPHVVGAITDVEGDENGTGAKYMLGRFLFAMEAEIKRRKILFNQFHVDSIDAYISACRDVDRFIKQKNFDPGDAEKIKKIANESPLAHLILVVDEFTELKKFSNENNEVDYMSAITSIARVGRSLGIHIILISQNIENAITDDIRVNSNARLCLRVATKIASKEMIGTEVAASSSMPGNGRAYLKVGTREKMEYFQSAYSGAGIDDDVPMLITLASKSGQYESFYNSNDLKFDKDTDVKTQLEDVTEKICEVYKCNIDKFTRKADDKKITLPHIVFRNPLPSFAYYNNKGEVYVQSNKTGGLTKWN